MKAFINQRFLNQTSFDSAAPAGSAVVAVELDEHGTYELALARKGKPFVRLPFSVGPEPAPKGDEPPPPGLPAGDVRRAVSVDLFKLARAGTAPPELPGLATAGWLSFTSAQPLPDHHVALRSGDKDVFDSRKLDEHTVFALTLIRPGRYSLQNTLGDAKAEIVVAYPKVGKTAYRPPEPLSVEVTKEGFGQDSIALLPGQGIVFRFATPGRIQIDLVEPDDGPKKSQKRPGPAARFAKQGEE